MKRKKITTKQIATDLIWWMTVSMNSALSYNESLALFKEIHATWDKEYMLMTQLLIGKNFTAFSFLRATPAMARIKERLQQSFCVESADSQRSLLDSESWDRMLQAMTCSINTFNNDEMQQGAQLPALEQEHKTLMEYYLSLCLAYRQYNNFTKAEITQFRLDQEEKFDEQCFEWLHSKK